MFDPILLEFLSTKLKREIVSLTEDYSTQIIGKEIKFNCKEKLKDLFDYMEKKNPDRYLEEKFKIEIYTKKENIEINRAIDILQEVMKLEKNENMTAFQFLLVRSSLSELKFFRNLFSHSDKISNELIQRFFENVYFLFKYIKLPRENIKRFNKDDTFLNEITFHMQNSLSVNLRNSNSFKYENSIIQDKLEKEREKKYIKNYEEAIKHFYNFKEEINKIFSYENKKMQEIYFHDFHNFKFSKIENPNFFFKEREEYVNFPSRNRNSNSVFSNKRNQIGEINSLSFINNTQIKSITSENRKRGDTTEKEKSSKDISESDLNISGNVNSITINTFKTNLQNDSDI